MNLKNVLHHNLLILNEFELICAGPGPWSGVGRSLADLDLVHLTVDGRDLMASLNGDLYELDICENCYERIIVHLLKGVNHGT